MTSTRFDTQRVHARPRTRTGWSLGPVSGRLRVRYLWMLSLLLLLTLAVAACALSVGTLAIPLDRLLGALLGIGERPDVIVAGKRLARISVSLFVGFALGAAGGLTQSLTRNPLASPDILGVTAGASLFAVLAIVFPIAGLAASVTVPVSAFIGGLLATSAVVALTWRRGLDPFRLVLAGIAITAICGSITQWLLMRTDTEWAAVAMRWLSGSVASATFADVSFLLPVCVLGSVAMLFTTHALGALRLGPDLAQGLGVRVGRSQLAILLLAVALVSCATAVAGPVGFVAFVAPQIAMRVFGTAGPPVFAAGLVGAFMVGAADIVARWLPVELPVGIITSLIGGPVLLVLLFHYVRRTSA